MDWESGNVGSSSSTATGRCVGLAESLYLAMRLLLAIVCLVYCDRKLLGAGSVCYYVIVQCLDRREAQPHLGHLSATLIQIMNDRIEKLYFIGHLK